MRKKYNHSINNKGDLQFYKIVDTLIGHLYDYYGGKLFNKILSDIDTPPIDYSKFSKDDFVNMYLSNKKLFSNSKKSTSKYLATYKW